MSSPAPGSPAKTLGGEPPKRLSWIRKLLLLLLFCFAQFLESFSVSVLNPAIPALEASTGITQSQSAWILSAPSLTSTSFLLISGRISDIYGPRNALLVGLFSLGTLSLCAGFVDNKIVILVSRAATGIAAAMAIPSSLALLVHAFPDPLEQARVLGLFGGCGAAGSGGCILAPTTNNDVIRAVLGLLIGAALVQYVSYRWVFWFAAIVAIPLAFACVFAIPPEIAKSENSVDPHIAKWKNLDLTGILILTTALALFIYAVTSGPADGWATAGVLAPLIISVFLTAGFFYWETIIPADKAVIPPRTWFYDNVAILFVSALTPFFWWGTVAITFTTLWQVVFHWTIISTSVHMLPIGVAAIIASTTGSLSKVFSPKWIILIGYSLTAMANVLCALGGGRPEDYWRYIFPAFIFGSAGASLTYAHTSIAIFHATPASIAGTVGAIFNGALHLGLAVGIAAFTAIETSVGATHGGQQAYNGRAAGFWFLLGIWVMEILSLSYFYQRAAVHAPQPMSNDYDMGKASKETSNEIAVAVKESKSMVV